MEEIQLVVVGSKPRLPAVWEVQERYFNRVTDEGIAQRIVKLKADVNVAVDKIDRALAASRGTAPPGRLYTRAAAPPAQLRIEYSRHRGKILDIR